jgi:hypothetical protein
LNYCHYKASCANALADSGAGRLGKLNDCLFEVWIAIIFVMADETTLLIAQLAAHGVRHLRTAEPWPEVVPPLSAQALITALAAHPAPRLNEALIPLFIQHPNYAAHVPAVLATLEPKAADTLRHLYTAAVYLQQFWRSTLSIYQGEVPLLPNYFGESVYGLPKDDEHFGELNLRRLGEQLESATGYEWLSLYDSVMRLALDQMRLATEHEQLTDR